MGAGSRAVRVMPLGWWRRSSAGGRGRESVPHVATDGDGAWHASQRLVTVRVGGCRKLQALSQTRCVKCTLELKVDDSALIKLAQANPDRKVPTVPPPGRPTTTLTFQTQG